MSHEKPSHGSHDEKIRSVLRPGNWQACHWGGDATDDGPDDLRFAGGLVQAVLFHHPNNPWVTTHPKCFFVGEIFEFSAQRKWSKIPKSKLQKFAHTCKYHQMSFFALMTVWQSSNHHLGCIKPVNGWKRPISVARKKYHHIEIPICKRMQYLTYPKHYLQT